MANAPSLQQQAGCTLRNFVLAAMDASNDQEFSYNDDKYNLLSLSRDFSESFSQALLMSRTAAAQPISQVLSGVDFSTFVNDGAVVGTETITPTAAISPTVYCPPDYKTEIDPLLKLFKSKKSNRDKLESWTSSPLLLTFYNKNPSLPSGLPNSNTYRNAKTFLDHFMKCFVMHSDSNLDKMVDLYENYKINATNWRLGCPCSSDAKGLWEKKWKRI